jgi:type II secretory pathway pseudopilin PulG
MRGFSVIELVAALATVGAIVTPVLSAVDTSLTTIRSEQSEVTLKIARNALVRYAAQNDGCLPFAADWEGALPDTNQTGATGYTDTGNPVNNARAGDLPWNALGLSETFRDGDGLRVQYYVASQYADQGNGCAAHSIGVLWNPLVAYKGTIADPIYLFDTPSGVNTGGLYTVDDILAAGTRPAAGGFSDSSSDFPPTSLLELRRGPNIKGSGDQKDVLSAQNVFVLIAAGDNINSNSSINRPHIRDENHRSNSGGAPWNLN